MKTTKLFTLFVVCLTLTAFECEDTCDALQLADLTIPPIADAFDQFGNPIIDQSTGQTLQGINELFYNQRTNEVFNYDNPPSQGLLIGDVIQMATSIHNKFSETECNLGEDATPTDTDAKLSISGPEFNGVLPLNSMPTPTIPFQGKGFTATAFQLVTPGYYSVEFNANKTRSLQEHSFNNNFYYGENGSYNRKKSFSFTVEESDVKSNSTLKIENYNNDDLAPKTVEEMKALYIYQFIHSNQYKNWILKKKNN